MIVWFRNASTQQSDKFLTNINLHTLKVTDTLDHSPVGPLLHVCFIILGDPHYHYCLLYIYPLWQSWYPQETCWVQDRSLTSSLGSSSFWHVQHSYP